MARGRPKLAGFSTTMTNARSTSFSSEQSTLQSSTDTRITTLTRSWRDLLSRLVSANENNQTRLCCSSTAESLVFRRALASATHAYLREKSNSKGHSYRGRYLYPRRHPYPDTQFLRAMTFDSGRRAPPPPAHQRGPPGALYPLVVAHMNGTLARPRRDR